MLYSSVFDTLHGTLEALCTDVVASFSEEWSRITMQRRVSPEIPWSLEDETSEYFRGSCLIKMFIKKYCN